MHLSPEEQLRRFERRQADPHNSRKLTKEDRRNRGRRAEYEASVEEMLKRIHKPHAPWHVVAGENKRWARVTVVRLVCEAVEARLGTKAVGRDSGKTDPLDFES